MTAGPPPPPAGDTEWTRLHPLSPLVRLGRLVMVIAFFLLNTLTGPHSPRARDSTIGMGLVYVLAGVVVFILGFISWLVTKWRIEGTDLRLETGVIRRQSFRIPVARIQAVDIVAPLLARFLGLAEVRVISAGRGLERGRLSYVSAAQAPVIRARLLAVAHGLAAETPEPPPAGLLRVDNFRLAAGLVTRGSTLLPVLIPLALALVLALVYPGKRNGLVALGVGTLSTGLILAVLTTARSLANDFNFSIALAPDGLRLDRGLFKTRHETIPFSRIQGVRWTEPVTWRLFGWSRLEVDVARQGISREGDRGSEGVARLLMPIARRDQVLWLLAMVMPGVPLQIPGPAQPPRRAYWKAPLSFHALACWHDDVYFCARTGRLQLSTMVVPLAKVQSVRLSQGPVLRAMRLATLTVDTAGRRWKASARCRDAAEAEHLLDTIADQARVTRRPPLPQIRTAPVTN